LITAEENNILGSLSQETFQKVIEFIKQIIISTDLANHFKVFFFTF